MDSPKSPNKQLPIDLLVVVIDRSEVERQDISIPLATLKKLLASPETIRNFQTNVDIAFHGYNETSEELFEMPEVRAYVYALDKEFPFWLYFLSRKSLGLQCLTLCFLQPYLKPEARAREHPKRFALLIENRWGPALNMICAAAQLPESEADKLLESAIAYFQNGRIRTPDPS